MIHVSNHYFLLNTANTSYVFRVMDTGHLEHLYYGKKIRMPKVEAEGSAQAVNNSFEALVEKHAFAPGNSLMYDKEHPAFSLEDMCLEMSALGKSDIREPFIELIHADGSMTCDFLFDSYSISKGKEEFKTLPGSYDESGNVEHLMVLLKDKQYNTALELHYYIYEECDVITRSARFMNESNEAVRLTRMLSLQLDLQTAEYSMTTFTGSWAREMGMHTIPLRSNKVVNSSYTGTSSNRANPFVMLHKEHTDEDYGDCYGFNLIYSGNHYEAAEVNVYGKTRFVSGINPQSFCFVIAPGEDFEAPEAVMTYSHEGFNGMSQHMHAFVREHIVRGEWKNKLRPVLLNSWEASYFDINEHKLLKLAKAGKEAGIELFVMDDGWFGERNDDFTSLGDWDVNPKKLPNGLDGLCKKVNELGLDFGIWVEPEMVNVKSRLYEAHPDWVMQIPDKPHSEGRNQRILDLSRTEVQDFIIEKMTQVFSSANIAYVKWDMNRIFSDYYSSALSTKQQGEVMHRYQMGLYRCMKELTARFPKILFEGCSAGGNRFDLGILCYFPQIWASDDTDGVQRCEIQTGYSYGYPMSVVSAHVSACPNHQTLRVTPLETRFHVAAFGVLGYECNLCDMTREERDAIKGQIALYKKWREVLQTGRFYRGRSRNASKVLDYSSERITEWTCVSKDKKRAVGFIMQNLCIPNVHYDYYKAKGLDEEKWYHFTNRYLKFNIKDFGDLVNTISPIHIKQDSILHNVIAKFVKLDGEVEEAFAYGDLLMNHGVKLKQAFGGTGFNKEVRTFQDFDSRIYFMEEED